MLDKFEILKDPKDHLRKLEWNDKLAVAVSLARVKHDKFISRLNFHCFNNPNTIYEYSLKILTSKEFPLMDELNNFIHRASEGGFIVKWLKGFLFGQFIEKKPLFQYVEVKIETLKFIFVIFTCLLLAAFLQAVLERIVHRKIQVKNTGFWKYVEMTIDSNRYFFIESFFIEKMKKNP